MKSIEFYVNKFKYIEGIENADISFIPSLQKRRLSSLDKITFASMNDCFENTIQNIVFSSQKGEMERLIKLIEQYKTENAVSPAVFSGSVHNFAVSSFLLNKNFPVTYTAVSAGTDSFIAALISAIASKYDNNLIVYSDIENGKYISLCLNISSKKKEYAEKFELKQGKQNNEADINDFINLFQNKIQTLQTRLFTIERINDD